MTRIASELARATRYQLPLSLLIVDVDRLKPINDGAGHAAGDRAIRDVALAIASSCRATDIAGRHGGDEFMVIAPNTAATAGVELAERIRSAVKARTNAAVSVSIGVADLAETPAPEALALCAVADQALYRAKTAGRDRVARAAAA
jgi:diguanylate cyclase (GGDEF)-like protein